MFRLWFFFLFSLVTELSARAASFCEWWEYKLDQTRPDFRFGMCPGLPLLTSKMKIPIGQGHGAIVTGISTPISMCWYQELATASSALDATTKDSAYDTTTATRNTCQHIGPELDNPTHIIVDGQIFFNENNVIGKKPSARCHCVLTESKMR